MRLGRLRTAALTAALLLAIVRAGYQPALAHPQDSTQADAQFQAILDEGQKAFAAHHWLEAKATFQKLTDLARQQGNSLWEGRGLLGLGTSAYRNAQYEEARTQLGAALAIFGRLSYQPGIARCEAALGDASSQMNQVQDAGLHYARARAAFEALGDRRSAALVRIHQVSLGPGADEEYAPLVAEIRQLGDKAIEGQVLHNWGDDLFTASRYDDAIDKLDEAAAAYQAAGDLDDLGTVYNSMGRILRVHGQPAAALQYQLKALAIHEKAGDPRDLLQSVNAVAVTYDALGEIDEARPYYDRALSLAEASGVSSFIGFLRANYGSFLVKTGDLARGLDLLTRALPDITDAQKPLRYGQISTGQLRLGRATDALASARLALNACKDLAGRQLETTSCIEARLAQADAELALGDDASALADQEAGLAAIEAMHGKLAASDFLRQGFADLWRPSYSTAIELHLRRGETRAALETAELARGRAFLDLLASRGAQPAAPAPAPMGLTLRGGGATGLGLRDTTTVPAPTTADLTAVAQRLHSTLLLYWVASDKIYMWVLAPDGTLSSASVPLRSSKLDQLIRSTAAFAQPGAGQKTSVTTRGAGAIPLTIGKQTAWRELYDLLVKPIESHLPRAAGARLTVVPHGPLLSVPFGALRDGRGRYLVERYAIHMVPAPAMLEFTATDRAHGARSGSVLLVADPTPAPRIPGEPALPRLPGASAEAHAIARLFPASQTTLLAEAGATEPRVEAAVANKAVIHFATHAIVRDADPLASFLALGVPRDGSANGQLSADKIYGLRLNADLVVLSACRSGGGVISGDGIAALARAFFYAGSASLMVSLWDVADEPTNRLLPAFYRAWKAGADKAGALRAAQLQLIADLRAGRVKVSTAAGDIVIPEDPAFWAGFVLIGEPD